MIRALLFLAPTGALTAGGLELLDGAGPLARAVVLFGVVALAWAIGCVVGHDEGSRGQLDV